MGQIKIYGRIGPNIFGEGVNTADFIEYRLRGMEGEEVDVHINSQGGDVFEGSAIYSLLRRHEGTVRVHIDGLAASAASLIAMAGDEIHMPANALMMVHNPWTISAGDYRDMRKTADMLEKIRDSMVGAYKTRTGKTEDELKSILDEETWLTADEAVAQGFATHADDSVDDLEERVNALAFADITFKRPPQLVAAAMRQQSTTTQPVPAVAAAQIQENDMGAQKDTDKAATPTAEQTPQAAAPTLDLEALKQQAIAEERARVKAIKERCGTLLPPDKVEAIVASGKSVEAAADLILDEIAAAGTNFTPTPSGHVTAGDDSRDKFRKAAADAILIRAGQEKDDGANHLRGMSLIRLAEEAVVQSGGKPSYDGRTLVKQAVGVQASGGHSTSDFPLIFEDVINKQLGRGYEEAGETWNQWANPTSLPDFRQGKLVNLNIFDNLQVVKENEEYTYGTFGEHGENIQVAKYGKLLRVSYEMIKNDDLAALTRLPMKVGRAAARVPGDLAYGVLTGNANLSDGNALFSAAHDNDDTAVISMAALDALRSAMQLQSYTPTNGDPVALNITAKHLVVPVALAGLARQILDAEYERGVEGQQPNIVRGAFDIVTDARLDLDSATGYYLIADKSRFDGVQVAFLEGRQLPFLDQKELWDVDAMEWKVRLECGAAAADYRTLQRSTGTA